MSDFALGSKFPDTLFQGMPSDEMAAVDAYEVQDEISVVNNFRRKTIDGIESLKNAVAEVNPFDEQTKSDIARLIGSGDIDRIKSEGLNVLANNASRVIGNLAPGLMDSVTNGIVAVKDKVLEALPIDFIKNGSSEILTNLKNSDLVKGMGALLDEVKDSSLVKGTMDLLSQSVMIGEMGALAVELGVPEFAQAWVDKAHDSVKDVVWARIGSSSILNSDLLSLNKALDNGGGAFIERYIDKPAQALLSNFKYKVDDTINNSLDTTFGSLKTTLGKLDTTWDTKLVGGVERISMDVFKSASNDAKVVLSTSPTYKSVVNTVGLVHEKTPKQVIGETIGVKPVPKKPAKLTYEQAVKELHDNPWVSVQDERKVVNKDNWDGSKVLSTAEKRKKAQKELDDMKWEGEPKHMLRTTDIVGWEHVPNKEVKINDGGGVYLGW